MPRRGVDDRFSSSTATPPTGRIIECRISTTTTMMTIAHPHRRRRRRVFLFLGYPTSIGPAGTKGAPGLTTRRTHRGSLKEYALKKNRIGTSSGAAGADDANADADAGNARRRRLATSTAMEPEIGFLMANLALAGVVVRGRRRARVLDPCCGGGRLLLYAAASGATGPLIGVDSDLDVWDSAEWEERHRGGGVVVGKSSPLPAVVPTFVVGDVWNPSSTAALCTPNSFDAIICDPPYNIGAPVLVDGQDSRPRNYHDKGHGFRRNESGESWGGASSPDIIPSILSIAANVLVMGGRIVFFLPVRGGDMTKSSEELLSLRGFPQDGGCDKSCPLRLLRHSSRRQNFSPTFSRWLVCMEKL